MSGGTLVGVIGGIWGMIDLSIDNLIMHYGPLGCRHYSFI
jgi:hypothetical protein